MGSIKEYEEEFGKWVDERAANAVKVAVAEGNKDLIAYLDTRFGNVEKGINDTGTMISAVSRDVGTVMDSVTKLVESVVAIPQSIVDQIAKLNPFHLP
jgi:archaellum component FlaC